MSTTAKGQCSCPVPQGISRLRPGEWLCRGCNNVMNDRTAADYLYLLASRQQAELKRERSVNQSLVSSQNEMKEMQRELKEAVEKMASSMVRQGAGGAVRERWGSAETVAQMLEVAPQVVLRHRKQLGGRQLTFGRDGERPRWRFDLDRVVDLATGVAEFERTERQTNPAKPNPASPRRRRPKTTRSGAKLIDYEPTREGAI